MIGQNQEFRWMIVKILHAYLTQYDETYVDSWCCAVAPMREGQYYLVRS